MILRADPFSKEALERSADNDFVQRQKLADQGTAPTPTDYRISVYAGRRETEDQQTQQLFERVYANLMENLPLTRKIAIFTGSELSAAEFSIHLSEPPQDHHDIVLGDQRNNLSSEALSQVFKIRGRIKIQ